MEREGQRPPLPEPGQKHGKAVEVSPPFLGGKNWNPMAYSQDTGLFVPANHWKEDYWTEEVSYTKGSAYLGMGFRIKRMYDDHVGSLRAMDPVSGKVVWEHKEHLPLWAGVLATAGNLVFTGTGDGYFAPSTRRAARSCGNSRPAAASSRHRSPGNRTASSTSA